MRPERSDEEVRLALLDAARPTEPPDPLAMVTVAETALLSGVPGSTLAYHFGRPDELRSAVYEEILSRFDVAPSIAIHELLCDAIAGPGLLAEAVSDVVDALAAHLRGQAATRWVLAAASRPEQQPIASAIWHRHGDDVARILEQLAAARGRRISIDRPNLASVATISLVSGWLSEEFSEPTPERTELDGVSFGHAGLLLWSRLRRFLEDRT